MSASIEIYRDELIVNFSIYPFDYRFPYEEEAAVIGYYGKVRGFVRRIPETYYCPQDDQIAPHLKSGKRYLELHFNEYPKDIYKGELNDVITVLRNGISDLLDIKHSVENKITLRGVDLIVGVTNERMANLLERKLGFHHSSMRPWNNKDGSGVVVFLTRQEFIRNIADLRERLPADFL